MCRFSASKRLCVILIALTAACLPPLASAAGEAGYEAANEAADNREYGRALVLYELAAEEGHVAAQRSAGYMRLAGEKMYGPEVKANPAAARRWFSLAAASGCGLSKRMLARWFGPESERST